MLYSYKTVLDARGGRFWSKRPWWFIPSTTLAGPRSRNPATRNTSEHPRFFGSTGFFFAVLKRKSIMVSSTGVSIQQA